MTGTPPSEPVAVPTDAQICHLWVGDDPASLTWPYTPAGFEAEGFVHLSTFAQLDGTVGRHFEGVNRNTIWVFVCDRVRLDPALRWEVPPTGVPPTPFPHLYRALERDDVVVFRRYEPQLRA